MSKTVKNKKQYACQLAKVRFGDGYEGDDWHEKCRDLHQRVKAGLESYCAFYKAFEVDVE